MKVGILTFHEVTNFGAFLQTYALSEIIKRRGHEPHIINLELTKNKRNLVGKVSFLISNHSFKNYRNKFLNETVSFEQFIKESPLDLYIVGSDQVWNKNITKSNYLKYFFDFLDINCKRIAYAASFGQEKWMYNVDETKKIKELLCSFEGVSVREHNGVKLCKEFLNQDVEKVLDPTLLLNDYSSLIEGTRKSNKENTIVCFKFNQGPSFYEFTKQFKKQYSEFNFHVIRGMKPFSGVKISPFATIGDWLFYIKNAPLVITDSFHGVCFSIIFKRKFIVIPADLSKFNRIENLLKDLGLLDRIFYSYEEVLNDNRWNKVIDYSEVEEKLNELRDDSLEYLYKWI